MKTFIPVPIHLFPLFSMMLIVCLSNFLIQYPCNFWHLEQHLTWGSLTYPCAFLVTQLTNRYYGPQQARKLVFLGFLGGVLCSLFCTSWRIALASGSAFLIGQLLDIRVFNQFRYQTWWRAPFLGSIFGSVIDTIIFFTLAFAGVESMNSLIAFGPERFAIHIPMWQNIALWDLCTKISVNLLLLPPYLWCLRTFQMVHKKRILEDLL